MSRKPAFTISTLVLGAILVATLSIPALAGEPAPAHVKALADAKLKAVGTNATVVAAVKAANAAGQSLDQIKARDVEWQKTPGVTAEMKALMDNACGKYLRGLQGEMPWLAESFVMDNQGANVAMTDKTSDYWQGDEPKWQESFKGGTGAVHVSDVKFDDSAQTYTVQISVPVMDGGKAIGAITFGIDVDKVQ